MKNRVATRNGKDKDWRKQSDRQVDIDINHAAYYRSFSVCYI